MVPGEDGAQRLLEDVCNLLETQIRRVTHVQNLLLRIREVFHRGLEQMTLFVIAKPAQKVIASAASRAGRIFAGPRSQSRRHAPSGISRQPGERRIIDRHGMAFPAPHLITHSIRRDPEDPRLKSAHFGVAGELLGDGDKGRLGDFLREINVPALGVNQPPHAGSPRFDQIKPRSFVTGGRGPEQSLKVVVARPF